MWTRSGAAASAGMFTNEIPLVNSMHASIWFDPFSRNLLTPSWIGRGQS